jgi:hypothetical protein
MICVGEYKNATAHILHKGIFKILHHVLTSIGPETHPASCTLGNFPGEKRPGRGVDHLPPSSHLCAFMACYRVNFISPYLYLLTFTFTYWPRYLFGCGRHNCCWFWHSVGHICCWIWYSIISDTYLVALISSYSRHICCCLQHSVIADPWLLLASICNYCRHMCIVFRATELVHDVINSSVCRIDDRP